MSPQIKELAHDNSVVDLIYLNFTAALIFLQHI